MGVAQSNQYIRLGCSCRKEFMLLFTNALLRLFHRMRSFRRWKIRLMLLDYLTLLSSECELTRIWMCDFTFNRAAISGDFFLEEGWALYLVNKLVFLKGSNSLSSIFFLARIAFHKMWCRESRVWASAERYSPSVAMGSERNCVS